MKSNRYLAQFIALLFISILALSLTFGQVAGYKAGSGVNPGAPKAPDANTTLYLPLIVEPPNIIYGHVTDGGVAAPGVYLALRLYDGIDWTYIQSATTNMNGDYTFTGMDALLPGQKYDVKYDNPGDDSTRLWTWETRELTSFPSGSTVNIGNFDIANVELGSPAGGAEIVPPRNFQWAPRPTTPSDSYQFSLFDLHDGTPTFDSPSLGYVSSYSLGSLPPGFQYCNAYYWGVLVNSPDGGWGASYWAPLLTLHQTALSGIHGCVTEGSVPTPDVPITLRRYNNPGWSSWNATTNANGYFQFTGRDTLSAGQFYIVEYSNVYNGPGRVDFYDTRELESYTRGNSVHIGDFDIADIVSSSPSHWETVPLPYTFFWVARPAVTSDSYAFSLYDPADGSPYFTTGLILGYVDHYDLMDLPGGFSYDTPYGWSVWVADPFGGSGLALYYRIVTFSLTGMGAAPGEGPGELQWEPQQLEAIHLALLSQLQDQLRRHPDFERLGGQK